jgi:iron complex outermembrane receptor protein
VTAFLLFPASSPAETDRAKELIDLPLHELLQVKIASLFLENELYVGSSVSKVTQEQWREQGAEKTFDAIEHLPGVYVSEYFNGQMIPSFRGFAATDQYNSFLLLLDGIPLNNYSSGAGTYGTPNFALGNLGAIEVIRGPGSTIYGANAFQGVVSLDTWSSEEDRYEAWAEAGSFDYWQANARVRHAFNERIRLTSALSASGVDDEEIDQDFHPSDGGPVVHAEVTGEYQNVTTSHKLAIDDFELALYYSEHDVEDSFGTGEIAGGLPNGNHSDGLAKMLALKLGHEAAFANGWSLESNAYHVKDELEGSFGLFQVGRPPEPPSLDWDSEDRRSGVNLHLKKSFDEKRRQMVFGYNYDYMEVERFSVDITGAPALARNKTRRLNGVMGQVEQRFLDDTIQLILGARYDDYNDFGSHVSPRLAFIVHPMENSALKFLYGNAFRAPALNEQLDNGVVQGGGKGLDPEVVDTFEIIWMETRDHWSYDINAYYSKVKDAINLTSAEDFLVAYTNGVDAESYGFELNASVKIPQWELSGNVAYNEVKQTEPIRNEAIYDAYPDWILNLGVKYYPTDALHFVLYNMVQKGRETLNPGPVIAPSYPDSGALSTLWRTDFHVNWKPETPRGDLELYLTILDLFDREDMKSAMNPAEKGHGTPGRRFTAGVRFGF